MDEVVSANCIEMLNIGETCLDTLLSYYTICVKCVTYEVLIFLMETLALYKTKSPSDKPYV